MHSYWNFVAAQHLAACCNCIIDCLLFSVLPTCNLLGTSGNIKSLAASAYGRNKLL